MVFTPPTYQNLLQSLIIDMTQASAYYGYNNGLGLSITPGSELYLRFASIAGQRAVLYQNVTAQINSKLISSAKGSDLDALAANFGDQRRSATSSQGFVQLIATIPINLLRGSILTGSNGLQYQVTQTSIYNPGQNIQIASVDQGSQTNLPVGSLLTWQSPLAHMQGTSTVSIPVTGGADTEDDATLRNRLFLSLQSPAGMGNGQHLTSLASSVDGSIQQAFIYSNFNGAGTQLLALTGYQTSSYIGRDIEHLLTDGYVKPYNVVTLQPGLLVQPGTGGPYNLNSTSNLGQNLSVDTSAIYGQLSGGVANPFATVITTVNNTPSDLAAVLRLPYPVGSPNNGFGNGWVDAVPWPVPDGYFVKVIPQVLTVPSQPQIIGSTSGFGLTIRAPSSGSIHATGSPFVSYLAYNNQVPTARATHIQWINRSDAQDTGWTVVTATVLAAADNGNDSWDIILDTPLTFATDGCDFYGNRGVAIGDFIFPAVTNAQSYLDDIMLNYALLGPGQVTASQGLLTLGASRYPSSSAQFPTIMGAQVEQFLVNNNQEVYAANMTTYNTALNSPTINCPPNIYVPRQIAFFPQENFAFGNKGNLS